MSNNCPECGRFCSSYGQSNMAHPIYDGDFDWGTCGIHGYWENVPWWASRQKVDSHGR